MTFDLRNIDCMELMAEFPDNHFELAIVDPPYGIGFGAFNRTNKTSNGERIYADKYKNSNWDDGIPNEEYFNELFRISKNQIIWGGNYFPYIWGFGGKCFIFWNKSNPVPNFADGELAWTSFNKVAKQLDYRYYGNVEGDSGDKKNRIHPTQKPKALYKWLLQNYANEGDKILDTHLGSGSIAIACHEMGFDLTGSELDPDYFETMQKRIKEETAQGDMFL